MFERFTDRARKIMALANLEAQRLCADQVGPEHILLGLIMEGSGVGANVLKNLDVNLLALRRKLESRMPQVGAAPRDTAASKRVIERALEESQALKHNYVGSEHLLLGLLRDEQGPAGAALRDFGLNLAELRDEIQYLLGQAEPPEELPAGALLPGCALCTSIQSPEANPSFIKPLSATHALLGDNQGCRGWCVLIVKDHREHMDDLPLVAQRFIFDDVSRTAAAIRSVFPTSGKDNLPPRINYECLGNLVPHIHWHLIPRHADDPDPTRPVWGWPEAQLKGTMTPAERTALIAKLRAAL
jgi:diadenosine tetraphosphate (Ap4A) HIT family hydrolase